MQVIVLSGGSGKRLWPLSNKEVPKQFVELFDGKSMVQRIAEGLGNDVDITFTCLEEQKELIYEQLGSSVDVSIEPCLRDTFPAIVLSCLYLVEVKGIDINERVVVCPADPYVNQDYFDCIKKLYEFNNANLTVMGVVPTEASEKYGYIIPKTDGQISSVDTFKEKPDLENVKKYISQGALWNCGVFAFNLGYVIDKAHEIIDFVDYEDFKNKYTTFNKISFDYAVVEKEKNIEVVRFSGVWEDIGTWNNLIKLLPTNEVIIHNCHNVEVLNCTQKPVIVNNINDSYIVVTNNGTLVSYKNTVDDIKKLI